MQNYLNQLREITMYGDNVEGRNGHTVEMFGLTERYLFVGDQFPIITTKKMPFKTIVAELLCFLRGYSDVKDFRKMGVNFWDENANSDYWKANPNYEKDSLGRIYGVQWRDWRSPKTDSSAEFDNSTDQLTNLIENLKSDPHGRRHVVTAWNPGELNQMCLPPCHMFFQVNVDSQKNLHLLMYQRSCDMFLGVPFNISSYALLLLILCHQTGYTPGNFTYVMGSAHIYSNHFEQVAEQMERVPYSLPQVKINKEPGCKLEDYEVTDFELIGYSSYDKLPGDFSV